MIHIYSPNVLQWVGTRRRWIFFCNFVNFKSIGKKICILLTNLGKNMHFPPFVNPFHSFFFSNMIFGHIFQTEKYTPLYYVLPRSKGDGSPRLLRPGNPGFFFVFLCIFVDSLGHLIFDLCTIKSHKKHLTLLSRGYSSSPKSACSSSTTSPTIKSEAQLSKGIKRKMLVKYVVWN